MTTSAAREGIPIFCPSPADGDITTDLAHYRKQTGRKLMLDPVKEPLDMVAVNAAVEDAGGRAGLITLGGGAPRNYGQQSMACAYMLDRRDLKKHNYGLRISLDPVETGGLSGSDDLRGQDLEEIQRRRRRLRVLRRLHGAAGTDDTGAVRSPHRQAAAPWRPRALRRRRSHVHQHVR